MLQCGPQQGTSSLSHSTSTTQSLQGLGPHGFSMFLLYSNINTACGRRFPSNSLDLLRWYQEVAPGQTPKRPIYGFWSYLREALIVHTRTSILVMFGNCGSMLHIQRVLDCRCIFHYVSIFRFNWSACVPAATSAAPIDDGGSVDFT